MCPRGPSLQHRFAEKMLAHAEDVCKVNCGTDWAKEQIEAVIHRGAHKSEKSKNVAEHTWKEVHEKVAQGYYTIHRWKEITATYPRN